VKAGVKFYPADKYLANLGVFKGLPVEIVVSAYLVKDDKVCLINHKDLKHWLPPGGHVKTKTKSKSELCKPIEGINDLVFEELLHEAVLREVREETGWNAEIIASGELYGEDETVCQVPSPRFVQYEQIKEVGRPRHVHINMVYFCKPLDYAVAPSGEEGPIEWFGLHDLDNKKRLFPHTRMNAIAAILQLGSIIPECLKVEEGRVLVPIGGRCAYRCRYCYTKRHDVYFGEPDPKRTAGLVAEVCKQNPGITITAQLGYDNDPFLNPELGLGIITNLIWLPVHIGFSTKAHISKETAKALSILRKVKIENKYNLSGLVTITSLESASKLEPYAPTPDKRFESVKNLSDAGIPILINLRPLLPDDVPLDEIKRIVYLAKEAGAIGIVIGAFWADPEGIVARGLNPQTSKTERKKALWSPHGLKWDRYIEDPEMVNVIKSTCKEVGLKVFDSTSTAVLYLNNLI
jgi:DNA repair photolyase/8-oxo-dGTP pyrophosphatase MutT (NUDIX family)